MRTRIIRPALAAFFLLLPLLPAQYAGSTAVDETRKRGFEDIDESACRSWLEVLAGPAMEGRGTGSKGYLKAAKWIAARLKSFGLEPAGEQGSYFQWVRLVRFLPNQQASKLSVGGWSRKGGDGLVFESCEGKAEGEAVLIRGKGKDLALQDPETIRGKVVILAVPLRDYFRSPLRKQIEEASPAAVLRIVARAARQRRMGRYQLASSVRMGAKLEDGVARKLLTKLGLPPKLAATPKDAGIHLHPSKKVVKLTVEAKKEEIKSPNVLARLEGSDPDLKDEVVICGAHLDHLGKRGNKVYPGADDDGSGSTALLALARAMKNNGTRPRRSVVFIWVCGEEMGLFGSRWYVENPLFPIEKTVCELQMDMVGRNEEKGGERPEDNIQTIHLVGSKKLSMDLHEVVLEENRHVGFEFEYDEEGVWNRSDHYSFAKKGIPIVFLFSGFHPDYHKSTDTVDKINFTKIANTARLMYLVAWRAANRIERIRHDGELSK